MSDLCRCGCGRPVAPDEGRRWQVDWLDALSEPGRAGMLAQRSVAGAALSFFEDAMRNWGCMAVQVLRRMALIPAVVAWELTGDRVDAWLAVAAVVDIDRPPGEVG